MVGNFIGSTVRVCCVTVVLFMGGQGTVIADSDYEDRNMSRFLSWLDGEFNNNEQVWQQNEDNLDEQERHAYTHHIIKLVAAPNIGEHTFFVKQHLSGDSEAVYRQRLYSVTWDDKSQAIRLAIHRFKSESRYRGGDKNPVLLADISHQELTYRDGCDVFWRFHDDHYIGQVNPETCHGSAIEKGLDIYLEDNLTLTESSIWLTDGAYDEADNKQIVRDGRYKNRKVRYFKGWAAIKNSLLFPDSKDPEGSVFIADLRIHNEGQKIALLTKKGIDSGYSVDLANLTYQNTRVAVLKLGLIDNKTGKTITYVWTNPGAERLGVNLRWLQVGLTAED